MTDLNFSRPARVILSTVTHGTSTNDVVENTSAMGNISRQIAAEIFKSLFKTRPTWSTDGPFSSSLKKTKGELLVIHIMFVAGFQKSEKAQSAQKSSTKLHSFFIRPRE